MKKIKRILVLLILIVLINLNFTLKKVNASTSGTGVSYKTHVQDVGWQDWASNGAISGTEGRSLRLEGIIIKINDMEDAKIKYQTHVQDVGWQDWKYDGAISGTEGRSLRLEGIKILLENTEKYSIAYRVHVQNIGWQDWKYDGQMAGTEGKSLRLEAIEIKLVNKIVKGMLCVDTKLPQTYYDNQNINISGWKMVNEKDSKIVVAIDNDENIVTANKINSIPRPDVLKTILDFGNEKENPKPGFSFNINSSDLSNGTHEIIIKLLSNNNTVLQTYKNTFVIDKEIHVSYNTHIQNIGWQECYLDGNTSGTTGRGLRVEAIKIKLINFTDSVSIKYQTHVQDIGWQEWMSDNEMAGTEGRSLRVEALKIKLEGTEDYSVTYRAHVQDIGWQDWCYDGESSGTFGKHLRIEAIQIKIVPKIKQIKAIVEIDTPKNQVANSTRNIKGWVMASVENVSLKMFIDNTEIDTSNTNRVDRNDVLNAIKGYGDENIYNKKPGYNLNYGFSNYSLGNHTIKVQAIHNKKVIAEKTAQFTLRKQIEYSTGTYGSTGLKVAGDSRGSELKYYKYGTGSNVFFGTFAIHGWEDKWARDGFELTTIADNFYNTLISSNDFDLNEKWTIYLFPGVNLDGLNHGYSHNGPGRTTLYSQAPGNKGIDLNRCWQIGSTYKLATSNRNYNGTAGFQAYETQYLRNFLLNNKSKTGKTVLADLHGWEQSLIGDTTVCSFYNRYFPENTKKYERYGSGNGYLIEWARASLGNSTTGVANAALIELPTNGINNHQDVINNNLSGRFIQATLEMLREM